MPTYFINPVHAKLTDFGKDTNTNQFATISGLKKCLALKGANRQLCSVEMEDGSEGMIATSNNVKPNPDMKRLIRLNFCDPREEICDVPDSAFID